MRYLLLIALCSGCSMRPSLKECMTICEPLGVSYFDTDTGSCGCSKLPKCKP